jgi:hypothetical protein
MLLHIAGRITGVLVQALDWYMVKVRMGHSI